MSAFVRLACQYMCPAFFRVGVARSKVICFCFLLPVLALICVFVFNLAHLFLLLSVVVWSTVLRLLLFGLLCGDYMYIYIYYIYNVHTYTHMHIRQRDVNTLCEYVCQGCFAVLAGKDIEVQRCSRVVLTRRIN